MIMEILTGLGLLIALFAAIPSWLNYAKRRKNESNLREGMSDFWQNTGQLITQKGEELSLSPREIVAMLSEPYSLSDLARWKQGAPIPSTILSELLDIHGINASELRAIAVTHLSASEYSQHIEPVLEGPNAPDLGLARLTWWLPFRYSIHKIPVITGPSKSNSQFRLPHASNFTHIDNLGDRDALFEVTRVLSRLYPSCPTQPTSCSSDTDALTALSAPLVLVGGIGYLDGTPNNFIAAKLFSMLGLDILFSPEGVSFRSTKWSVIKRDDGEVIRDVSVFARVSSPFDHKVKIFSLQGVYTRGVLGSALSFGLGDVALHNHRLIQQHVGHRDFIAIFYTDTLNGTVFPTKLKESDLYII